MAVRVRQLMLLSLFRGKVKTRICELTAKVDTPRLSSLGLCESPSLCQQVTVLGLLRGEYPSSYWRNTAGIIAQTVQKLSDSILFQA